MAKLGKILVIDDNEDVLLAAKLLLKGLAVLVHTEKDPSMIPTLLRNENYDIILLDMNFTKDVTSGSEGFYWLAKILEIDPSAVVMLITAYGDVELAVKAMKEGATLKEAILQSGAIRLRPIALTAATTANRIRIDFQYQPNATRPAATPNRIATS